MQALQTARDQPMSYVAQLEFVVSIRQHLANPHFSQDDFALEFQEVPVVNFASLTKMQMRCDIAQPLKITTLPPLATHPHLEVKMGPDLIDLDS
jgi:hypothetical protein